MTAIAVGCSKNASPPSSAEQTESAEKSFMQHSPQLQFRLPLFKALWELDDPIRERFPVDPEQPVAEHGISALGLGFRNSTELENGDYSRTPKNSVVFAWSGCDGEHYSFIVRDNSVDETSPVILTAPSNSGNENHLLALNFREFLRLGLRRGFFGLGQFAYWPKEALAAYGSPDWKPTEKRHYSVGFVPDDRQRKVLAFVAESLELEPLSYSAEEYNQLQTRLDGLIETGGE